MARSNRRERDEVQFTVTYAGPDLAEGRMDASVLGAAMVDMAALIDAGAGLTLGRAGRVNVDVVADFRHSSFAFDVIAGAEVAKTLIDSFDMSHLLDIIGVSGGGGVIGLALWLRNRKVKALTPQAGQQVKIETEDGDSTVVHAQTVNLFQNSTVRMSLEGIVRPLEREGITEFRAGTGTTAAVVVRQDEIEYFEAPEPAGELLQDRVQAEIVRIVSITFQPGRKWRFALADGTNFFSNVDEEFSGLVMRHDIAFGAGDALEVELRSRVTRDPTGGLTAHREIVRVIRHLPAPKQFPLWVESRLPEPPQ